MISETSLVAEQTAFLNLLCRGPECGNIIKYSIAGKKIKRTSASSRTEALVSTVNNGKKNINWIINTERQQTNCLSFLLSINAIFIVSYKITIQGGKHYDIKNIIIQFGNYTG